MAWRRLDIFADWNWRDYMNICFPRPLCPGDLIAIPAPSSGVSERFHPRLDLAIGALHQRGFRVVEGKHLRRQHKDASAAPAHRAAELMGFLTNPEVAAVMPPWGGELAIELLPLIDFEGLRAHPAKWFSGFSDLSTLQLPLLLLSGWATLHGPNLMELGAAEPDELTASIWCVLTSPKGGWLSQTASRKFQRQGTDWVAQPGANLVLSEDTQWKRLDGLTDSVQVQGRLIGGCLDTVARLAGTPFGDVPSYVKSSRGDGVLLYFENVEMKPCELLRALFSVRLSGWFDGLDGILIGRSAAPDTSEPTDLSYVDALQSALNGVKCPVLYDMDIGHVPPQLSLVNGALAQVEFHGDSGTVAQQLGEHQSSQCAVFGDR